MFLKVFEEFMFFLGFLGILEIEIVGFVIVSLNVGIVVEVVIKVGGGGGGVVIGDVGVVFFFYGFYEINCFNVEGVFLIFGCNCLLFDCVGVDMV